MTAFRSIFVKTVFVATACGAFVFLAAPLVAQDRSYGRSVVATQYGIVATSQVSASQAGARVLEQGGSAIDAAIAANAVLNVTEPNTNGMGGDLFAIYWEASHWRPRSAAWDRNWCWPIPAARRCVTC